MTIEVTIPVDELRSLVARAAAAHLGVPEDAVAADRVVFRFEDDEVMRRGDVAATVEVDRPAPVPRAAAPAVPRVLLVLGNDSLGAAFATAPVRVIVQDYDVDPGSDYADEHNRSRQTIFSKVDVVDDTLFDTLLTK